MQLIDTHVHINFKVFEAELAAVRSRWQAAGVVHLVHSCVEPGDFVSMQNLADQFPELSLAVGLHPLDAHKWTDDLADQILTLANSDQRVVAIGETGLDFYKADNPELQSRVFTAQLAIASQLNKPVIIHCRDAAAPMAALITQWSQEHGAITGVMHCWGGTPAETQWFLDLGFYISFSGTVTFKNADQIRASAAIVPTERLLIETDCPFLAPTPKRGQRNEPAYVSYVAEQLAKVRGVSLSSLAAQTTENACRLFQISVPTGSVN